jgi:hypothetical protein
VKSVASGNKHITSLGSIVSAGLDWGDGNRIVACDRYYKPFYVFSIFNMLTNLPSNFLDLNERHWTTINVNLFCWHKAETQLNNYISIQIELATRL